MIPQKFGDLMGEIGGMQLTIFNRRSTGEKRRTPILLSDQQYIEEVPRETVVCRTKARAIAVRTETSDYPGIPQCVSNLIMRYFRAIGAQGEIPEDEGAARDYIYHFHELMTEANEYFPHNIDYLFVYERFFHAVITGKTPITGFNFRSQLQAFRNWILGYDWERLEAEWRKASGKQQESLSERNTLSPQQEYEAVCRQLNTLQVMNLVGLAIYKNLQQRKRQLKEQL